ncbi:hypothetical protein [Pseudonocardia phyllosphaerae]|uniref:hypothetical protein n=1 Tax=Pseudonocardia phyllosphaerae TaxID=3390502 RepID=UPI00397A6EE0
MRLQGVEPQPQVASYYDAVGERFACLARRWAEAGLVAPATSPDAVARAFTTLMPGMIVMQNLVRGTDAGDLYAGLAALATGPHSSAP